MIQFIFCLLLGTAAIAAEIKTVTVLNVTEPHEAMVFHADHLWVGQSRPDYRVLIFDRADQKVGEVTLNHSVTYLYPYDAKTVIAVGTGTSPNLTMYTRIARNKESFASKTTVIPMEAWANRWVGTVSGREYFSDPGGNSADETTDLSLPAQTLFRMDGARPRYLSTRLRLPVGGIALGKNLWVIQREAIGAWQSNLAVVDTLTGKSKFAFPAYRRGLSGIAKVESAAEVAVIEREGDLLTVVDQETLQIQAEIPSGPEPRALVATGSCLAVGSFSDRGVRVFRRSKEGNYEPTLQLENPLPENEFRRLFQIAVDTKGKRVYARSNFACNPMVEVCNQEWNRVVAWSTPELSCGR